MKQRYQHYMYESRSVSVTIKSSISFKISSEVLKLFSLRRQFKYNINLSLGSNVSEPNSF